MNFGQALEVMKEGQRVARAGWNGKDMWIFLARPMGLQPEASTPEGITKLTVALAYAGVTQASLRPCFCLRDVEGNIVCGWTASQTDLMADDWGTIPD